VNDQGDVDSGKMFNIFLNVSTKQGQVNQELLCAYRVRVGMCVVGERFSQGKRKEGKGRVAAVSEEAVGGQFMRGIASVGQRKSGRRGADDVMDLMP